MTRLPVELVERLAVKVRRSRIVREREGFWNAIRPIYCRVFDTLGSGGVERNINGTDRILMVPEMYSFPDTYEPDVWRLFVADLRPGDHVVDVGASFGLYTVLAANHVGPVGRVYAFEPDPGSARRLREHIRLNNVTDRVVVRQSAVGDTDGDIGFLVDNGVESTVLTDPGVGAQVKIVRLDTALGAERIDVMKIDVEGYEESVVAGAMGVLKGPNGPRCLYIEVHPFAWAAFGASSEGLLGLLDEAGYAVTDLEGRAVDQVSEYGEVIARRLEPRRK